MGTLPGVAILGTHEDRDMTETIMMMMVMMMMVVVVMMMIMMMMMGQSCQRGPLSPADPQKEGGTAGAAATATAAVAEPAPAPAVALEVTTRVSKQSMREGAPRCFCKR